MVYGIVGFNVPGDILADGLDEGIFMHKQYRHFCHAMLCKCGLCHYAVSCLSVRLSVETNKHILIIFHHWPPHHSGFSMPNVMPNP